MTTPTLQTPILICGPTASGKSSLAMRLAKLTGGYIVNADALQVYDHWRVLTARPSADDENEVPHRLYGHVDARETYSVGAWLREVKALMSETAARPIIVGGTGLYFTALTNGLAVIPETPDSIRSLGNRMRGNTDTSDFIEYLAQHDPVTLAKTDQNNAMRLQRAWEVHKSSGRGLVSWQKDTPPPLVTLQETTAICLNSKAEWLNQRISKRFDAMIDHGALDECQSVLKSGWEPSLPSSKALGAAELIAYIRGECSLAEASERATIVTRQFAKRQRTWFRSKMKDWQQVTLDDTTDLNNLADNILQNGSPT